MMMLLNDQLEESRLSLKGQNNNDVMSHAVEDLKTVWRLTESNNNQFTRFQQFATLESKPYQLDLHGQQQCLTKLKCYSKKFGKCF